jgi:hypothetical protein
VSVKPEMPVGPFTFPMAIKTDVSERNADGSISEKKIDFNVLVSGTRRGPIRINGGPEWVEEKSIASLGTFSAADGKKIKLQLLMKSVPEEGLKLTSVESDPATLKFSLTPVEKKTGVYHRFDLTVEFPAGGPRVTRRDPNPAKVRLGLNHPDASELTFNVYFTAY